MNSNTPPLLKGTLDMLILRTLSDGTDHGYGIARSLRARSRAVIVAEEGTLYPALHRLERGGFVRSRWGESEQRRRAKFYALTAKGRRRLETDVAAWRETAAAIDFVLADSGGREERS